MIYIVVAGFKQMKYDHIYYTIVELSCKPYVCTCATQKIVAYYI